MAARRASVETATAARRANARLPPSPGFALTPSSRFKPTYTYSPQRSADGQYVGGRCGSTIIGGAEPSPLAAAFDAAGQPVHSAGATTQREVTGKMLEAINVHSPAMPNWFLSGAIRGAQDEETGGGSPTKRATR